MDSGRKGEQPSKRQGLVVQVRGAQPQAMGLEIDFKPLLRHAGLPDIPFHALRHSFATLMLSGREHPKVVQEMLGHSRINTTLDFYSHVLPDMQREAVDRLDVMLS